MGLEVIAFCIGFAAGLFVMWLVLINLRLEPAVRQTPVTPKEEPRTLLNIVPHTHNWRMSSAEQTQGKDIHVYVCYEHEQPVIERREVGRVGG